MRAALACLLLLGCAGVKDYPLPAELRPSEGYVVLGGVRGNVGVAVGGSTPITRDPVLRLDDPAERIAGALAEGLQRELALKPAQVPTGAGLVLHIGTIGWGAERDEVFYAATARLVDSRDGRELAHGRCAFRTAAPGNAELVADGGARLNAELARAAERCVPRLRPWFVG